MSPGNVIFPPPPPLTDIQKHALTLYIRKKRAYYDEKDAIISRKYKWLEDLNQIDPDLEGIEISEASLEELKKKRENLCEEKHKLFEKLKNILPPTEEEEMQQPPNQFPPQATQPGYQLGQPPGYLTTQPLSYPQPVQPGYHTPYHITSGYPPPSSVPPPGGYPGGSTPYTPYTPYSSTPYSVVTEPITPKKPSEMSPVHGEGPITRPSDMSPISSHERSSYNRNWDNISPVNKPPDPADHFTKFTSEYATPSAATKYAETRENRIDSFTKAFTDTISKAMMSELNMSLGSATKAEETAVPQPPVKPAEPPAPPSRPDSLLSPKHKPKEWSDSKKPEPMPLPKTPEAVRKHEPKTPDVVRRGEGKTPDVRRVEHPSGKSRKSISGTESNSSVSSKHLPQSPHAKRKEEPVSDLPPVIKISKAEIHSKVMSWPTSHPFQRKPGDRTPEVEKKPAGKKESADSSGSSLLEFAFQSALFGNALFNTDASPTTPQGPKTPPAPSTSLPGPSDLLTALSMSYGGGPPRKQDKPSDDRKEQEKSRKRDRSPDVRSPSPELVQVYKTEPEKPEEKKEEEKSKEVEKKTTPPPPPPPPPPPKSTPPAPAPVKKVIASPATPTMKKGISSSSSSTGYGSPGPTSRRLYYHQGYTPCSPSTSPAVPPVPYSSFHSPLSFLSPTHPSQYPASQFSSPILNHKSPMRSPMMNPYSPAYPPPSPIRMLPPPVQPPMVGLPPPHMPPLPPPHLLHPSHKNRSFPPRYM